jgi:tetratricopeptide (TPR) repeat protein
MKKASICMISLTVGLLGFSEAVAEVPEVTQEQPHEVKQLEVQDAPRQLSEEQRRGFAVHVSEASRLFQLKRIPASLEELGKAEAIFGDSQDTHNLRGSCYVEMRDFAKAMEAFKKADALAPGNLHVSFNIAEVYFVEHRWDKAAEVLGTLQPKVADGDRTLAALVDLKLLVCHYKLGALGEAGVLATKRADDTATPYQWYAKAVIEFENKNRAAAAGFLEDVKTIHPGRSVNAPFMDALVESGYVKN